MRHEDQAIHDNLAASAIPAPRSGDHDMYQRPPGRGPGLDSREAWTERSRIVLTPVAAPSILGLFGFAGATFMVASLLAGWWWCWDC
jgi:uncharacterized protein